jgi:hypothetical protein
MNIKRKDVTKIMIKGEDPWEKKETFKEWLRYFCTKHNWDPEVTLDRNGDGYVSPTLKLFLKSCWKEFYCWNPIYRLRMFTQKLFRQTHLSDNEIWEAGFHIAKYNLKLIKAFKKYERHGYPSVFMNYDENCGYSKEKYDELKERGLILSGGPDAWERILDHIIMAFEYIVNEGNRKTLNKWWIDNFGMDPYDETNECNKYEKYDFRYKNDPKSIGAHLTFNKPPEDPDNCEYIKKEICYGNTDLILYAESVVQEGLELFGKYFRSFWD